MPGSRRREGSAPVSRRARAIAFGAAALACAGLAAAMASGYRSDVASQLGALRPVVVASRTLAPHKPLTPQLAQAALEVRKVPARFVPPGAIASPEQALGQAPAAPVPAGAYVLAPQLAPPHRPHHQNEAPGVGPGREPVEIAVADAGALAAPGASGVGRRVDVIVTSEPRGTSATGRTYVAAAAVRLLDLRRGTSGAGTSPTSSSGWIATLALTREQALQLIQAESFARGIRLIGAG
jgi:Flp pilus assembly protein CpaB